MATRVTKEFSLSYGHILPKHEGKCSNLHGHNARLLVTIEGEINKDPSKSEDGMVMDFGNLKAVVNEAVVNKWDHKFLSAGDEWVPHAAFMYDKEHPEEKVLDQFVFVGVRTTAENLSFLAAQLIHDQLPIDVRLVSVVWEETSTSFATFVRCLEKRG